MNEKLETGTIRQNVFIPDATPKEIYDALLSSKEHSEITGEKAVCSAQKGAKFTAWNGYIKGRNVSLTRDEKIVQEWQTTEWPDGYGPSTLEISLRCRANGTELSIIQTDVPASQVRKYDHGWHDSYWNPMKEYFRRKKKNEE